MAIRAPTSRCTTNIHRGMSPMTRPGFVPKKNDDTMNKHLFKADLPGDIRHIALHRDSRRGPRQHHGPITGGRVHRDGAPSPRCDRQLPRAGRSRTFPGPAMESDSDASSAPRFGAPQSSFRQVKVMQGTETNRIQLRELDHQLAGAPSFLEFRDEFTLEFPISGIREYLITACGCPA